MLIVLALGQIAALTLSSTALRIVGNAVADHDDEATDGTPVTDAGSKSRAPTSPASSTTTSADGDSPPDVAAVIAGARGSNGWYVGDVQLSWTVTDEESSDVTSEGCDSAVISTDTKGAVHSCTATSEGGTRTTTATIARDATAPVDLTVTTDAGPAPSGWFTSPFKASWHAEDVTSGVARCTTDSAYDGPETTSGTLEGTCVDEAGNESDAHVFAFKYDATAPAVTGVPSRRPDHNGWYNRELSIAWESPDGDAACDRPTTYAGPDDALARVSGACRDAAGNEGAGTFEFKYDGTAPVVELRTPRDGDVYILRQPVKADYACSDATSGVDGCSGTAADGGMLDTSSVGSKQFAVRATDRAGNTAGRTGDYSVRYQPAGFACDGGPGHTILEPIAHRSSFKQGSSVPAKFRVCDWFGRAVATSGVVDTFRIVSADGESTSQGVRSTSSHDAFRAGDGQWIFNIDTKSLAKTEYGFRIALDDGTAIDFGFTLR
ncbi:MAG TPA: PxKF domain-containing protein [Actinomycetota bacterium]|nr:PxKF domain-containing protein [Actinomycetota bacterium]